jgi:hypothetical protein
MKFWRDHFTNWIQSGMVKDAPKKDDVAIHAVIIQQRQWGDH